MKLLVTGGAGYIGSHFVRAALAAGHTPVVYDDLSTGHIWAVPEGVAFHKGSVAEGARLERILRDEGIEAVVHFAASSYVGESVSNPSKYFNNNYAGTLCLLDAMRAAGVARMVLSSTCAVYGVPERVPITEDAARAPISPYGLTKLFIEQTLEWYSRAYDMRYLALRYFNAAGADPAGNIGEVHDPETHIIPRVLEAAAGLINAIDVYGTDYPTPDGTCIRDYIHVNDLAQAHLLGLGYLTSGGQSIALNLGTEHGASVRQIIDAAARVTGRDIPVRYGVRREGDPPVLIASSSRARQTLGWSPKHTDIEQTIKDAWLWLGAARERDIYHGRTTNG